MSHRASRTNSVRSHDGDGHNTVENKSLAMYEDTLTTGVAQPGTSSRARGYSSIMNQGVQSVGTLPTSSHSGRTDDDSDTSMPQVNRSESLNDGQMTTPPNESNGDGEGAHLTAGGGGGMKREGSNRTNGSSRSGGSPGVSANDLYDVAACGLPPAPPPPTVPKGIMGAVLGHQANGPHATKLILSFVAGFVLLYVAVLGLNIFFAANWFHDPGPYASDSWPGYNASHYAGLVMFTVCSTVGFSLFYVPLTIAGRYRSSKVALVLLLAFAVLCLVVGLIGILTWGHPMMHCLGYFCVAEKGTWEYATKDDPYPRPSSGLGYLVVLGTSAFLALFPVGLVLCLQFYDRLFSGLSHNSAAWISGKYRNMHQLSRPKPATRLLVAFLILVFLLFFFAGTGWIPNSWEYFTAEQVASNARIHQTMSFADCNNNYNKWTCGELPWATFGVGNWKVSENLIIKFYPANVFFYTYLMSVLLFIVGARTVKPGRLFLKSEVKPLRCLVHLTYGELIVSLSTLLMVFLFSWYWFHDHNYNGSYGQDPNYGEMGIAPSERYARSFGQLAVVLLSLLLFPASRNSVIHRLFGTSWEASLWAHKTLGWGMIAATISHVVAWYIKYNQKGLFPKAIFSVPTALPESIDNFTVPIITIAVIVLLITTIFLTYDGIRRGFFELFYYPHLFAAYLIIPTALWHAAAGWEYMIPGVTVWFVDRVIRMYRSGCEVLVTEVRLHEDTTEIRFQCPRMSVKAGQYVFINIPELSLFEWHPFTLSSGVGSAHFSVHIKAMYDKSWTARLLQLMEETAEKNAKNATVSGAKSSLAMETVITLAVDGPYGHSYDFEDYDRVVLVAGGIGVTPVASIYQSLQRDAPNVEVLALWSTRKLSSLDAFRDQLEAPKFDPYKSLGKTKRCKMFLTKSTDDERKEAAAKAKTLRGIQICSGRPDIESECQDETALPTSCSTLLFVCGPLPLVEDAREVAQDLGYHFHAETFFL